MNGRTSSIVWYGVAVYVFCTIYDADSQGNVCIGRCNNPCTCPQSYSYQCGDGSCVNITAYRNGIFDCNDQTDEDVVCCPGYFKCDTMVNKAGKCLSQSFVDDGVVQCMDGSDETATNDKTCTILTGEAMQQSVSTDNFIYRCQTHANGSKNSKCIKREWCLDGKTDCPLGDDEDTTLFDRCKVGAYPCNSNADCNTGSNGTFTCTCRLGFQGDGVTCNQISSG